MSLFNKLQAAREACPGLSFGALIESIEEKAWDLLPQRHCSLRLSNMTDLLFERGLDAWMVERSIKVNQWKS